MQQHSLAHQVLRADLHEATEIAHTPNILSASTSDSGLRTHKLEGGVQIGRSLSHQGCDCDQLVVVVPPDLALQVEPSICVLPRHPSPSMEKEEADVLEELQGRRCWCECSGWSKVMCSCCVVLLACFIFLVSFEERVLMLRHGD